MISIIIFLCVSSQDYWGCFQEYSQCSTHLIREYNIDPPEAPYFCRDFGGLIDEGAGV